MLEGRSESQSASLDLMFSVCLCAFVHILVYVYFDARTDEKQRINLREVPDRLSQPHFDKTSEFVAHFLSFFLSLSPPCVFFPQTLSILHDPLPSVFSSLISFLLSSHFPFSLCLHIFPYLLIAPLLPSSCPPLPLCLWLSSSDRLLMQALYESISPSAVVELAPLLSRQDLFISLPT